MSLLQIVHALARVARYRVDGHRFGQRLTVVSRDPALLPRSSSPPASFDSVVPIFRDPNKRKSGQRPMASCSRPADLLFRAPLQPAVWVGDLLEARCELGAASDCAYSWLHR